MTQKWKTTCSQKGKFFRPVAVKIRDILHRVTRPYLDGWIDKQAATDNFPPSRAYFRQNLGPLLQFLEIIPAYILFRSKGSHKLGKVT